MAFSLVAHTVGAQSGSVTTPAINTTGANLIILGTGSFGAATGLTDSFGNTWTALTNQTGSPGSSRIAYCLNPTVGAGHTFSLGAGFPTLCVTAWSGAATSSAFDVENGFGAAGAVTSIQPGSVTPANANSLIVTQLGAGDGNAGPASIGGGFTISDQSFGRSGQSESGAMAYLVQTSIAAANPTWTLPSDQPAATIAVFKAAAVSGITATGAWTESRDAWAGSVTLTFPTITANAAWTEARDAWAGSVTVAFPAITAAGAWTEAQDLWNGSATVAQPAITANGAWVERQDIWNGNGGPPPLFVGDAHDPGWRKRRKQQEAQRLKDFQNEQALRARRRAQVIDALERIVEGKPRISEAAAEEIAQAIEAEQPAAPSFDFDAALKDINRVQAAWDAYLDRDDEDVLGLL